MIDHSLDEAINSTDEEYIMRKIRQDYLSDSTVTIHLIGQNSAESRGLQEQKYIILNENYRHRFIMDRAIHRMEF